MEIIRLTEPLLEANCYILREKRGCIVIDPNDPLQLKAWFDGNPCHPEWIFLSHEHCDHIYGLEWLRDSFPGVRLLISQACDQGIQNIDLNMSRRMRLFLLLARQKEIVYPPFVCRPADQVFEEKMDLTWEGHDFFLIALPGHSPGSTGIMMDHEIFFSGDYLLPEETTSYGLPGGNWEEYDQHTQPFLAGLPMGITIYPGHGSPYRYQGDQRPKGAEI